ncbi:MAG: cysteine peptidase family C39 domain-containing protein [Agathobacter rectalis]
MRYTFIKQHDATDCAAACMGMVCLHYRKETTITKLRDLMGTDLKGTNLHRICQNVQSSLDLTARQLRVDRKDFLSRYTLPADCKCYY